MSTTGRWNKSYIIVSQEEQWKHIKLLQDVNGKQHEEFTAVSVYRKPRQSYIIMVLDTPFVSSITSSCVTTISLQRLLITHLLHHLELHFYILHLMATFCSRPFHDRHPPFTGSASLPLVNISHYRDMINVI